MPTALERKTCSHGHDWAANAKPDASGRYRCSICERARLQKKKEDEKESRRRRNEKLAEEKPEPVLWFGYQLDRYDEHLRGEKAIAQVYAWFVGKKGHLPTVIRCHAENVCTYRDVTVRESIKEMGEPPTAITEFWCR